MNDITAKLAEALERIAAIETSQESAYLDMATCQGIAACELAAFRQHTEAQAGWTEGELPAPWGFIHGMSRIGEIVMRWSSMRPGVEAGETADELEEAIRAYAIAYHRAALAAAPAAAQGELKPTRDELLKTCEILRAQLADPPGDVQELVLRKLGLMGATVAQAKAEQAVPVAHVPLHPRNGPLWSDTFAHGVDVSQSRPSIYPTMALYTTPPAVERRPLTPMGEFEDAIRRVGVVAACEWFGYSSDSEFTAETVRVLNERAGITAGTTEQAKEQKT